MRIQKEEQERQIVADEEMARNLASALENQDSSYDSNSNSSYDEEIPGVDNRN
jgi:hypothetical protein